MAEYKIRVGGPSGKASVLQVFSNDASGNEVKYFDSQNLEGQGQYSVKSVRTAASATLALTDRTFNVVDAKQMTNSRSLALTMPATPSAAAGRVADVLLRIDTGTSVPALAFDLSSNVFIPLNGDDAWGTLEASSHNIFSFTSMGTQVVAVTTTDENSTADTTDDTETTENVTKRVWLVGRATAAIVDAESVTVNPAVSG